MSSPASEPSPAPGSTPDPADPGDVADLDPATIPVRASPDAPYPRHWEADVVAADGATAHLRPISPADADAVVDFHSRLSDRTRYYRYFSPYPTIPERDLKRFVADIAFVGLFPMSGQLVAKSDEPLLGSGDPLSKRHSRALSD